MVIISSLRRLRHGPLRGLGPLWLWLGNVYRKLIESLPFLKTSQYINKYGPFELDAKFAFSNFEHWGQGHNDGFVDCIEDCRGKECIFDIGAHIGLVSLPASRMISGMVYAFEPAAANLKHLRAHIKHNNIDNVEIQTCLVGMESKKEVEFFERDQATGMNSRVVKKDHHLYHKTTRDQISLDDFCHQRQVSPEVIKIDVEGAEYEVLLGARKLLLAKNIIIYLSIHPKELSLMGHSVEQLIAYLEGLGYNAYDREGARISNFGFSEYRFIKKDS